MFTPKSLRADYGDYLPAISKEIMDVHYNKHYLGYVNNLNNALSKYPDFFKFSIAEILGKINEIPEDIRTVVRNNGGGAMNHEILWETLSTTETSIHEGKLKEEVERCFGSWEKFLHQFEDASLKLFGSGWVWLVLDRQDQKLKIVQMANQDSPYMFNLFPVLGMDVWEHAYYLQYKNVRAEYLKNVMKIISWKDVEKRLLSAI